MTDDDTVYDPHHLAKRSVSATALDGVDWQRHVLAALRDSAPNLDELTELIRGLADLPAPHPPPSIPVATWLPHSPHSRLTPAEEHP